MRWSALRETTLTLLNLSKLRPIALGGGISTTLVLLCYHAFNRNIYYQRLQSLLVTRFT